MLLKAFPGEILFSRLCRSLSVSGMPVGAFTRNLKLESRSSFHPFLTQHLAEIAASCHDNVEKIWSEQTMFPLWAWSMPYYSDALRRVTGPPAHLLWFYKFTGNHHSQGLFLKFCPMCARENAIIYGVPYWHSAHQIPGINVCYRHHCRLISRKSPPSPHIAAEFYPDDFHTIIACEEIESEFANFATEKLIQLSSITKTLDDNTRANPIKSKLPKITSNKNNASINDSLHTLIQQLWSSVSEPVIIDKTRFLQYILDYHKDIFPAQKLFLAFCLQKFTLLSQKKLPDNTHIVEYYAIPKNKTTTKKIMEINFLANEIWRDTSLITENHTIKY